MIQKRKEIIMKKYLSLILTAMLLLSLLSCGNVPTETTSTTAPAETTTTATIPPAVEVKSEITYMNISYMDAEGNHRYFSFSAMGDGIEVEYQADVKKVAQFESEKAAFIDAAFSRSALAEFNGQSVYEGEGAYASMYVQFRDNSYMTADFSGIVPEAFLVGYRALEAEFETFMQDIPVYVPKPLVMGDVDADVLAQIESIVNSADFAAPDGFYISDIPLDDYFAMTAGLSSKDGIVNGTALSPMMMPTPYSLVIVTVEDEASMNEVCADFEKNVKWNKWVCVSASDALIATKENMVLFLMGDTVMYNTTSLYRSTKTAITAEGWTIVKTLERDR